MRSIDTNVVIRYLVGDDPHQTVVARQIIQQAFLLPLTVLMESEWVLRSRYRWPRERIGRALVAMIDLPTATVPEGALWAAGRFDAGADMADMIHIASSFGADSFATFDGDVATGAGAATPVPVETLA